MEINLKKWFGHLRFHSMKLAALVSAAVTAIVTIVGGNAEMLFAIIAFIPTDPVTRFIFACGLGFLIYFGADIARFWPQPKLDKALREETLR